MAKQKLKTSEAPYGELGKKFDFTLSDLEDNREGYASERQREILQHRMNGIALGHYMVVGVLTLIGLGIFSIVSERPAAIGWLALCASVFFGFAGIVFYIAKVSLRPYREDLREDMRLELVLARRTSSRNPRTQAEDYFFVGLLDDGSPRLFPLEKAQYDALSDRSYRLYYTPHNRDLLSLEAAYLEEETDAKEKRSSQGSALW